MKYLNIYIALLILGFNTSCKKESAKPEFEDKPVIESYLEVGAVAKVSISKLIAFSENAKYSTDNLDNIFVTISDNANTYILQSQGNGSYAATSSLVITEGLTYSLNLSYNNKNVSANTIIPSKPTNYVQSVTTMSVTERHSGGGGGGGGFGGGSGSLNTEPLKLTWANNDNSYYLVLTEVVDPNSKLIDTTAGAQPRAFRGSPIQSNTAQIMSRQFQYYGMHRLILYHLNPDYAALYDNSSNNSNNLTNSSTGVVNSAGIFTGINSDTLLINILKP